MFTQFRKKQYFEHSLRLLADNLSHISERSCSGRRELFFVTIQINCNQNNNFFESNESSHRKYRNKSLHKNAFKIGHQSSKDGKN